MRKYTYVLLLLLGFCLCVVSAARAGTRLNVTVSGSATIALTTSATATSDAIFINSLLPGAEIQYSLRVESSDGGQVGLDYVLGVTPLEGNYITPRDGGQLVSFQGVGEITDSFKPGLGDKLKFVLTEQSGSGTATVYLVITY